jgi:hypothetical protein
MQCTLESITCQAYYQPAMRFCFLQRLGIHSRSGIVI